MKNLKLCILFAGLTACAGTPTTPVPAPAPVSPPAPAAAVPPLKSGLDLAAFDTIVRPQDDLFRHAGGRWLANTPIPADRSAYGSFDVLADEAEAQVRAVIEAAAAAPRAAGTPEQKIGDFYASFMDVTRLAALRATPLTEQLRRIDAIRGTRDLYAYFGYAQRIGVAHPLILFVGQDSRDATQYLTAAYQSGLTMPDRDYYLSPDDKYVGLRAAYRRYVEQLLALAGDREAPSAAKRIEALETRIANHHWTRVQNRDPIKTYNRKTLAELPSFTPTFDWPTLLNAAGLSAATAVDVSQPSYVQELAKLVRSTPLADWRAYLRFQLLDNYAPLLSSDFERLHWEFHRQALQGVQQQEPRWKQAVRTMDGGVGELIGQLYVARHFSPADKERVRSMIENLRRAFDQAIGELEWMSEATKAEARRKLQTFTVKIGYPDRWRDYSTLHIDANDLVGNVRRAAEHEFARNANKLGKPLDRGEWLMTPQTVNAYYYPPLNEIVFPAAILRPPFFFADGDDAVNYGGIGAVIGHEFSHGFDDQGRQFDGAGNLRDWWTFEDNARFRQRAGKLVDQYAAFTVLGGKAINGELTLGENIGDLSGLALAYRAYRLSLNGNEAPTIDNYTGAQRFFLGWAQVWRCSYRDAELQRRLVIDPHSPCEFRANGPLSNMNEFYEAFGLREGDRLYRPAAERVRIW